MQPLAYAITILKGLFLLTHFIPLVISIITVTRYHIFLFECQDVINLSYYITAYAMSSILLPVTTIACIAIGLVYWTDAIYRSSQRKMFRKNLIVLNVIETLFLLFNMIFGMYLLYVLPITHNECSNVTNMLTMLAYSHVVVSCSTVLMALFFLVLSLIFGSMIWNRLFK
jgi:F0F1-type ATP synthase membrane subunit c/vacuolar-type H+-ATPase subunit K